MKYRMNVLDKDGRSVKTGYEHVLEGTKEECIFDYENWLLDCDYDFPYGVCADLVEEY